MWEHWGTFQRKAKQKNINTREVPSYVFHFNLDIGFLVCRCHYRLNDRAVAKKKPDKNRASELRRQDSNVRPPGYEPGELPTAPLRDIIFFAGAKVILFFRICKFYDKIFEKSYISRRFPLLIQIKTLFLHTTQTMCNTKKHRREHHVDIKNKTTFG